MFRAFDPNEDPEGPPDDLWTTPELASAFNSHYAAMKEKYDRDPTDEEKASFELKQKMNAEENAKKKKELEAKELQAKRLREAQEEYERERKREEEELERLEEQLGWKEPEPEVQIETEDEIAEREARQEAEKRAKTAEKAIGWAQAMSEKQMGNIAFKEKNYEKALRHYSRAIRHHPIDMTYYNNRAATYFEMGNFKACVADCKLAVDIGRRHEGTYELIAKAFARMGRAYRRLRKFNEAIKAFNCSLTEKRDKDVQTQLKECQRSKEQDIKDRLKALVPPSLDDFRNNKDRSIGKLMVQYMQQQCEYRQPRRAFSCLWQQDKVNAYQAAIKTIIQQRKKNYKLTSVLCVGGAGLWGMVAKGAGAENVASVEFWKNTSDMVKKVLEENHREHTVQLLTKKVTDIIVDPMGEDDVRQPVNLLIVDVDHTTISKGIVEYVEHAKSELLASSDDLDEGERPITIIPARATVFAQCISVSCGLSQYNLSDMSAYQWNLPCQTTVMKDLNYKPLTHIFEVFDFDFHQPIKPKERKCDLRASFAGRFNAIVYWWDVSLLDPVPQDSKSKTSFSTGPGDGTSSKWKQMIVYVDERKVKVGDMINVVAVHDKKKIVFSVSTGKPESAPQPTTSTANKNTTEENNNNTAPVVDENKDNKDATATDATTATAATAPTTTPTPKPALPLIERAKPVLSSYYVDPFSKTFEIVSQFFEKAIYRAVSSMERGTVNVIDVGSGTGQLAMVAKMSGAKTVTAVEESNHMAAIGRKILETNKISKHITYLNRNSTKLAIPADVKQVQLVVGDVATWKFMGKGAMEALFHARHVLCLQAPHETHMIPYNVKIKAQCIQIHSGDYCVSYLGQQSTRQTRPK